MPTARPHNANRARLLRWVAALTLAGVSAAAVIYLTAGALEGALFLPGVLVAACLLATCETWALRPLLGRDAWVFFAATAIGAGWGALSVIALGVASLTGWAGPFGSLSLDYALPVAGALMGALLSLCQWLVLRRQPGPTGLWIPTHVVAGAASTSLFLFISSWLASNESSLPATLAAILPASALAGAITGLAVLRLVSRPVP